MEIKSQAKIISYNVDNGAVCAGAARISTTSGNSYEIFEKSRTNPKNQDLIRKVLLSGHKSLIEHAVFTIALCNVSAFAEQFFIEFRLASFTVKSRRYVDFARLGYYIPSDLEGEALSGYIRYMDMLFGAYQEMLDGGIPKEDARFLLPYSFNSNFYCTVNARELAHIICDIKYGRGRGIPELQALANQLTKEVERIFPALLPEFERKAGQDGEKAVARPKHIRNTIALIQDYEAGAVEIISSPQNPLKILEKAYSVHAYNSAGFDLPSLVKSERARELEQLSYTFLISNVTLSGITHIVRHRMQSIIVPPIQGADYGGYIVPATIKSNSGLLKRYEKILAEANSMAGQMRGDAVLGKYSYYYALSGNMMDIFTTMNARQLMLFIRLRACRRAQWEVRNIAVDMLKKLRLSSPEIFNYFGPSCYVNGRCPEGVMTCGRMDDVISSFRNEG